MLLPESETKLQNGETQKPGTQRREESARGATSESRSESERKATTIVATELRIATNEAEMPVPVFTTGLLLRCQHCLVNHFHGRKTDLFRFRIQTATQRKPLRFLRFSGDISPIDSDCRRTTESEFVSHSFVSNEHFLDLRSETFRGQNLFDQFHRCGMRRTLRHIQDFNFHLARSGFLGFLTLKIGQRADRLLNCRLQLRRAKRSSRSSL